MTEITVFGSLPRGWMNILLVFVMQWSAVLGCLQLNGQNISFPATSPSPSSDGFNSGHHGVSLSLQFTCSGQVDSWGAYFRNDGVYSSIWFQVWRPQNTTDGCTRYNLIGTNSFENHTINDTLRGQFVPASESLITFQVGDVVGFYVDFDGMPSNNSLQSNPVASADSYTYVNTDLNAVGESISTGNCSISGNVFLSVPFLTASVTEGTSEPSEGSLSPSQIRPTRKPDKAGLLISVAGLVVMILVILVIIASVVVVVIVVFIYVLSPNVLRFRRKGRGRDLTTLTVAVNEVYPQPVPKSSDPFISKKLDSMYELPPDSTHYATPRASQLGTEYEFMNPRNTLAKQGTSGENTSPEYDVPCSAEKPGVEYAFMNPRSTLAKQSADTEYDIPSSKVEPDNTLTEMKGAEIGRDTSTVNCLKPSEPAAISMSQQDGNNVKDCGKAAVASLSDPEYTFMDNPALVSNKDESEIESSPLPLYEMPLIPMEVDYTVMSPSQSCFRDEDDEKDYCEVGPLEKDQENKH